jgi:hypothetical protein
MNASTSFRNFTTTKYFTFKTVNLAIMKHLIFLSLMVFCWSCGSDAPGERTGANDKTEKMEPSINLTIRPGEGFGAFTNEQSQKDLSSIVGKKSIVKQAFNLGEGEVAPGLLLYPGTRHEVEVLLDEDGYPLIYRIQQEDSEWRGPKGLTIGTSLAELEKMNGKPFRMAGFGWDYGGTVTNWADGALEQAGFMVVLGYAEEAVDFTPEDTEELMGDQEISSTLPSLKRYPIEVVRIEQRY